MNTEYDQNAKKSHTTIPQCDQIYFKNQLHGYLIKYNKWRTPNTQSVILTTYLHEFSH